ncbi:MAG TPA: FAD-dependent oxidoreductase [Trueperaceae bacterium]|nr:FAD-dependent oxidoreductase [Trueperaceae bacterium]
MSRPLALLAACVLAWGAVACAQRPLGPSDPGAGGTAYFDVVVYGSEPEGVAAAVAASEEGARTLLVSGDARVGGLFVLGELNMLDMRTQPFNYQRGFFERWWRQVGSKSAFDVLQAEDAFGRLLADAGVEVWLGAGPVEPRVVAEGLRGVLLPERNVAVNALQVIDASANADLAAKAGAPFDFGWERFGVAQRQADTLVLNVAGVDWEALRREISARGRAYASISSTVAWGHFGGMPAAYVPTQEGTRLRGLNLGLQRDGSVLVNALLLYGLDPLDPVSLAAGRAKGLAEGEAIVAYLKKNLAGFANARLAGAATELYVRESRHLLADCVLSADDTLSNVVTAQDVAAGGYPLDAQSFTPHDAGFVWGAPDIYGGRLCMLTTSHVEDLWVVGRSAGYDPVAFASARVVPFGMAMAEAAGVAAATAVRQGVPASQVAQGEALIGVVRAHLLRRGALLPEVRQRMAVGPVADPAYPAFRVLLARGLAVGGYDNDPELDGRVSALSFAYLLSHVATRFYYRPGLGAALVGLAEELTAGDGTAPLSADVAGPLLALAACLLDHCPPSASWQDLRAAGLADFAEPMGPLTRGDSYRLAAALAASAP